jgi:hypothetical protein
MFSKNTEILNLMKIRRVGAEWFHADRRKDEHKIRQTDMMKLIIAFRCFAKEPNNKLT